MPPKLTKKEQINNLIELMLFKIQIELKREDLSVGELKEITMAIAILKDKIESYGE